MIVTRFAPSPTGLLHLGHAFSAFFAFRAAQEAGGRFLLRFEDIDPVRCKPEYGEGIIEDLRWLGLSWEEPVRKQSEHLADYAAALKQLRGMGLLYPCFCTRREIEKEAAAAVHAPHGVETLYPGICRNFSEDRRAALMAEGRAYAWRLDVAKAVDLVGPLVWIDRGRGDVRAEPEAFGDVVLARKDIPTSYHLSVVVDDALQGVTLVTRGEDLFDSTHVHRLLQALLGLPTPLYHHHRLLTDGAGRRFAKRDKAMTLKAMRDGGMGRLDILNLLK